GHLYITAYHSAHVLHTANVQTGPMKKPKPRWQHPKPSRGTKTEKYSIHDHKSRQVFTTTVSNLRLTDAGKYWCGVTRDGLDIYTEKQRLTISQTAPKIFQRHKEDSVSFICSYDSEHQNNLKYVCRGNQTSTCLRQAVVTSDSPQNGMFTLQDDKESRQFNVTIALLTQEDSGWYLCGVQMNRHGQSRFSAVEVKVKGARS
uniref:Immunoglobulin V-set domain-containing protein n=1 Tax=Mola mola TaxID=94237 RepID=A0A3Q4C010_MOLML